MSLKLLSCTLMPIPGRDYRSKEELLSALAAGKDFILNDLYGPDSAWDGKPVNAGSLFLRHGPCTFNVRYRQLRSVAQFDLIALPEEVPAEGHPVPPRHFTVLFHKK